MRNAGHAFWESIFVLNDGDAKPWEFDEHHRSGSIKEALFLLEVEDEHIAHIGLRECDHFLCITETRKNFACLKPVQPEIRYGLTCSIQRFWKSIFQIHLYLFGHLLKGRGP